MTTSSANNLTISDYINNALDAGYARVMNPVNKQIDALTKAPGSQLQRALKALEEEADRLEADGNPMKADNPVLKETMNIIENTFATVATLIQANDNQIEASGSVIAIPSVTAKIFLPLAGEMIKRGVNPVSSKALTFYREQIKRKGIKWQT
jgi:hypothetical protein